MGSMATDALPTMPGQAQPSPATAGGMFPALGGSNAQTGANMQDALKAKMRQYGELISAIETLARDAPEASQDLDRAVKSVRSAMMKVTSRMTRGQEGPQPPVLG